MKIEANRARKRRFLITVGTAAAILVAVGVTSAPAAVAFEEKPVCTDELVMKGWCAPTVYIEGKEDPLEIALSELANRGLEDQANLFLDRYIEEQDVPASTEEKFRSRISNPEITVAGEVKPSPDEEIPKISTQWDDGKVLDDRYWELNEDVKYAYCTPQGCGGVVGSTTFNFWQNMYEYPKVGLGGSIYRTSGPAILPETVRCRTYYEPGVPFFDQILHEWGNCTTAQGGPYSIARQVTYENFLQGSANASKYHLELYMAWRVQGDSSSAQLTRLWNSNTYTIISGNYAHY